MPESAAKALVDDGRLIGSDGAEYRRQQDGRWERSALFGFSSAEAGASMRQELDATSALLREGLAAHRDMLAQRPVPEPLSFESSLANMAASAYASHGIALSPEAAQDMGRALAADYRARELDGPLMLRLQPDPTTQGYGPDSPIGLHTRDADGDMTLRFTMTPAEARAMLDAPDAVRPRNDDAPAALPASTEAPSPERHSSIPSQRSENSTASAPRMDPRDPHDPDHRLYKQIQHGVIGIDAERGRSFDAVSERMTLCAFCDAKAANITSADHVAINRHGKLQADGTQVAGGTLLFIVQGQDPADPAARRSVTDVAQAVQRTVDQSLQNLEILAKQPAQNTIAAPVQDEPARAMRMA